MMNISLNRAVGTVVHKHIIIDKTHHIVFPLPVGLKYINILGIEAVSCKQDGSSKRGFTLKNFVKNANLIARELFEHYNDYRKGIYDDSDSSDDEDEKTQHLVNYVDLFNHWFFIANFHDFGRRAYRRAANEIQKGMVNLYVPFDNPLKQLFDTLLLTILLKIECHAKTQTIHREIKRLACCVRMFPSALGEEMNIDLNGRSDKMHVWQIADEFVRMNGVNTFELAMITHYMRLYRDAMIEKASLHFNESVYLCYARDHRENFELDIRVILRIEVDQNSRYRVKEKGTYGPHEYSEYSGKRLILRAE